MTNKEIDQDLISRGHDDASFKRELEFKAAVRQGLSELDNGDNITIEEVEKELPLLNLEAEICDLKLSSRRSLIFASSLLIWAHASQERPHEDQSRRFRSIR